MSQTVPLDREVKKHSPGKDTSVQSRVRLRTVALPTEHGGWSLTLEPILLGLIVAPSLAGLFLSLSTMGAFLARHPYKILMADRRRGRRFPRTAAAERFLLLYAGVALASALAAAATAANYTFVLPLLLAAPFASVQLIFDAQGRSRALAPELAGAAGLAAVSSGIAVAGGRPLTISLVLWAVLAARVLASILYVRARLRLLHGEVPSAAPTLLAHIGALALVSLLAWLNLTSFLVAVAFLILLLRALAGLWTVPGVGSAKKVGLSEIGYGVMVVLAVASDVLFG